MRQREHMTNMHISWALQKRAWDIKDESMGSTSRFIFTSIYHKIYIKRVYDFNKEIMISTWRNHEIYTREYEI